jgi:deoxycytidylate deaminase
MTEFRKLSEMLPTSGCDKRQVAAGTYCGGVWFAAVNRCEHEGDQCPRLQLASGEGYHLCKATHAEASLVERINAAGLRSDGIAWVFGHYYACEPCASTLTSIGVREIRVRAEL